MKKQYFAVCVESFEHVDAAKILELRSQSGEIQATFTAPEKRTQYTVGQRVQLSSHRSLAEFVRFHDGKFTGVYSR